MRETFKIFYSGNKNLKGILLRNVSLSVITMLLIVFLMNILGVFGQPQPLPGPENQLTTNPSVDFYPAWSPNGTEILFASDDDGDWVIYSMNVDGSDQREITSLPGWDFCPAWGPNGTRIAYLSNSSNPEKLDIWIMNSDGSNRNRLLDFEISDMPQNIPPLPWSLPSWSPDGTAIAFAGYIGGDQSYNIWITSYDGKRLRRLTEHDTFDDAYAAWSPEGTKIAFQSDKSGNWDIWVINSDGSNLKQLTHDSGHDYQPAWSPNGTYIAFVSERTGDTNIWVMNSDGNDQNQLTSTPLTEYYPSWSPDGKKLAFASNRADNWDIWVMNLTYSPGEISFQDIPSEAYVDQPYNISVVVKNHEDIDHEFTVTLSSSEQDDFQVIDPERDVLVVAKSQRSLNFEVTPQEKGNKTVTITLLQDSNFVDDEFGIINVKPLASLQCYPPRINRTGNLDDLVTVVISIKNHGEGIAEDVILEKNGSIAGWIGFNASWIGEIGQDKVANLKVHIKIPESGISPGKYNGSLIIDSAHPSANFDPVGVSITIRVLPEDVFTPLLPSLITAIGSISGVVVGALIGNRLSRKTRAHKKKRS